MQDSSTKDNTSDVIVEETEKKLKSRSRSNSSNSNTKICNGEQNIIEKNTETEKPEFTTAGVVEVETKETVTSVVCKKESDATDEKTAKNLLDKSQGENNDSASAGEVVGKLGTEKKGAPEQKLKHSETVRSDYKRRRGFGEWLRGLFSGKKNRQSKSSKTKSTSKSVSTENRKTKSKKFASSKVKNTGEVVERGVVADAPANNEEAIVKSKSSELALNQVATKPNATELVQKESVTEQKSLKEAQAERNSLKEGEVEKKSLKEAEVEQKSLNETKEQQKSEDNVNANIISEKSNRTESPDKHLENVPEASKPPENTQVENDGGNKRSSVVSVNSKTSCPSPVSSISHSFSGSKE